MRRAIEWAAALAVLAAAPAARGQSNSDDLNERLAADRHFYHVHVDLGDRAFQKEEYTLGAYHFRKAAEWSVKFRPSEFMAFESLGDCYKAQGNGAQAAWAYSNALAVVSRPPYLNPGAREIRFRLQRKLRGVMEALTAPPPATPAPAQAVPVEEQEEPGVLEPPPKVEARVAKHGQRLEIEPEKRDKLVAALDTFRKQYLELGRMIDGNQGHAVPGWLERLDAKWAEYGLNRPAGSTGPAVHVQAHFFSMYGELMTLATADWQLDKSECTRTRAALEDLFNILQRELGVEVPGKPE